ncbi:hypothetical protein [Rhodococcus pyridinivorans]|uniref:hypothetical protein n=1 Tax=Rhodococcus pyridinivorans TaxID=103816 RepID=UPI00110E5C56|nr:hypothetical protein [Rhodococcus pyridinivorans]
MTAWLDLDDEAFEKYVLYALEEMHSQNVALMAAAMIDDPGTPTGFEDAEVVDWYPDSRTGRIQRHFALQVPSPSNAFVELSVVDEIVDQHVVRSRPTATVTADGELTSAGLMYFADSLTTAARKLTELSQEGTPT